MEPTFRTSCSSSEDDYISMDVDGIAVFHHHRRRRSSSAKEFEFQSFSSSSDADHSSASPADELFYMGKLLPLHLPPRLQMVHTILSQNTAADDEFFTPAAGTPFESCNISPSESCHVSAELNPADYFMDYLSDLQAAKSRVPTAKRSSGGLGAKLNWRYFKSLFTKSSGCSNEYSAAAAAASSKIRPIPKPSKQCANSKTHAAPFGQISYKKENSISFSDDRGGSKGGHRRSFSGAFKRLSKPKHCSDSSPPTASVSAQNLNYRQILKRCSSSSCSELENPIQAAIAHCKRSQQRQEFYRPTVAANRHEWVLRS